MSSYYSNSFETYNAFEEPFGPSYASTQSTSRTEFSSFEGAFNNDHRSPPAANAESLFENLGLGAASGNPNSTLVNDHVQDFVGQTRPRYATPTESRSAYEEPWSPMDHQFMLPYYTSPRASTKRSRHLEQPLQANLNITFPPWQDSRYGGTQEPHATATGGSRMERVAIPRMQRMATDEQEPGTRHQCLEPDCSASCGRLSDLKRHYRTVHSAKGSYWLCDVYGCGYWQYENRADKMWEHCRSEHNQEPGRYQYHLVDDVGQQPHAPKVSVGGKQTRRRKKRAYS